MTAPVAVAPITAPAAAPSAPSEATANEHGITDDLLASIAAESARSTVAAQTDEEPEQLRDPRSGKFAKKEGEQPVVAEGALPVGEPAAAPVEGEAVQDAVEVTLPEGMVAVPSITAPVTDFKVFDTDGELEAPALTIEFKANGKVRRETLDQTINLAKWGVYNAEREQAVTAAGERAKQMQADFERVDAEMQAKDALILAMLQDDNVLLAEREKYVKENTPERQLERERQARQELEVKQQYEELNRQGSTFFSAEVLPSLDLIKQKLTYVSPQEIDAKAVLDVERFKTIRLPNGDRAIHPKDYDAYRSYIVNDLIPWAQHVNAARLTERGTVVKTVTDQANAKVEDAQIRGQQSKNLVTKVLKPVGRGAPTSTPPKPKAITGADDAMDEALSRTLSAVGVSRGH